MQEETPCEALVNTVLLANKSEVILGIIFPENRNLR